MTSERQTAVLNGWLMLPATIVLAIAGPVSLILSFAYGSADAKGETQPMWALFVLGVVLLGLAILTGPGYFTLQPNEARVLVLFGSYKGTTRQGGFCWGNPFYSNGPTQPGRSLSEQLGGDKTGKGKTPKRLPRYKISLRARTLNGDKLKVNDKSGNPVEIAAVVVWRVHDTAQAVFDVDDFQAYVSMQSESAVRHLATEYAYDQGEDQAAQITLRGNVEEVSAALREELGERLAKAGVAVDEARLTHLAYAPEIAQAMLRRQQAEAVIAARRKIVEGATGMVEMALARLTEQRVVEFDEERKAAMVSNLMVVLCGESQVTPVVNTGTLYQ